MSSKFSKAFLIMFFFITATMPGCLFSDDAVTFEKCDDPDNCLTIAFETKEEYKNTEENPQKLADRLAELLDMDVEIYPVSGPGATIEALRFGKADIGFLDGGAAWLSWQTHGLEVLGAEQKQDGRPFYKAIAWVHKDSDMALADLDDDPETDPYALMEGKTSCHTSALGSSGMLLPMGFMIDSGYIEVVGDPDDIESLTNTVKNYFSEDSSIPDSGTKYYKYIGSLRCLAEGGKDFISFAKDPTVPDYCGDDPESWCFEGEFTSTEDFHGIGYTGVEDGQGFGKAPSHPIMYNPTYMDEAMVAAIQEAFTTMTNNGDDELQDVMSTPGITIINTEDHLGNYGSLIEDVPGIEAYFNQKYD